MKNKIFFSVILLLVANIGLSQILVNASGQVLDGTFNCENVAAGNCIPVNELVNCNNWMFVNEPPSICKGNPYSSAEFPSTAGGNYCSLVKKIENGIVITDQNLVAKLQLVANNSYKIQFKFANLGSTDTISKGDWSSTFKITIGGEEYVQQMPEFSVYKQWTNIEFEFCATTNLVDLVISSPQLQNEEMNMSSSLIIDDIVFLRGKACSVTTPPCLDCSSFKLKPNAKYRISGWVKHAQEIDNDEYQTVNELTYDDEQTKIQIAIDETPIFEFAPSGEMVDYWQKITGEFTLPEGTEEISIVLQGSGNYDTFFDDIRINPIDSTLKSFVYDQESQKLMAELDENNYATFYEYDKEGGLVRVKKETEKGIFTIQESRSGNKKVENITPN